ncbi:hypothetical protein FGAF374_09500 [Escherichia coli]|uniref:Uncharacterized protein n=1 Tax=Escherichia coli TaxID=562 RepID=A0A2Y0ZNX4_ECOLX|nr:hypothetical protein FGAF1022_21800 [Escherichia coli]CAK0669980.1 hypothetical protein FGAF374_09500 [Escherichia coli]SRB30440.1 Uncharacterised protein [Escherichia coli]STE30395.1 Uncharacterised protein [Escherichia coli]GCO29062.1 hypothetical protein ExPECSC038_02424 [Escherichia coli]
MHSELPFMNVLLNVITLTVHPRRWYYAGCVNNMKEQQYLLLLSHVVACSGTLSSTGHFELLRESWRLNSLRKR